jgi:Zn-dependent protease
MNLLMVVPFLFLPRLGLQLALCNMMLAVINLLPLPSSDGLRILRNLSGSIIPTSTSPAIK